MTRGCGHLVSPFPVSIAYSLTSSSGDWCFDPRKCIEKFSVDLRIPTSPEPPGLRCFPTSPHVDIDEGDFAVFSIVESNQMARE